MTGPRSHQSAPLTVAASLVAVEGAVLVLLAVAELVSLSAVRLTMGLTTAVFFVVYGAGLLLCGLLLHRRVSWARSPAVLAQLIQLGLRGASAASPRRWWPSGWPWSPSWCWPGSSTRRASRRSRRSD